MTEEPKNNQLEFDDSLVVNEATLELLERRLRAKVLTFFGGGGIAAIVLSVFFWIPQKINGLIDQPEIRDSISKKIDTKIAEHLESEKTKELIASAVENRIAVQLTELLDEKLTPVLKTELDTRLPSQVKTHVAMAVDSYFEGDGKRVIQESIAATVMKALPDQVPPAIERHFESPATQESFERLVNAYLRADGRDVLVKQVNQKLNLAATKARQNLDQNRVTLLVKFESESVNELKKGSYRELEQFTTPPMVASIKKHPERPVILGKVIGGELKYKEEAIEAHLHKFEEKFGEQFRFIAISCLVEGDTEKKPEVLAFVPATKFKRIFDDRRQEVMGLINSQDRPLPPEKRTMTVNQIVDLFGEDVLRMIPPDAKVASVLNDRELWSVSADLQEQLPVVDEKGQLLGVTSRSRLVAGLLGYPP